MRNANCYEIGLSAFSTTGQGEDGRCNLPNFASRFPARQAAEFWGIHSILARAVHDKARDWTGYRVGEPETSMAALLRYCIASALILLGSATAHAQQKLVVSIWGGNWRDGAKEAIATEFTKRTNIPVEFITGGTMDRLTKAKVAAGKPESDVTLTTSHVAYLYVADKLFEKLDQSKIPNLTAAHPLALRSPYHIGLYSYVYIPAFRTDLMPAGFTISSWRDLWGDPVKGKLGLADFDPSHIIVVSAILSGGSAQNWKAGIPLLEKLKPSIKAFYQSDATSQELIK